jgi:pilus assembly protein CpaB
MRSRSMVLLALALGCGLVASIGISQVMDRRNTAEAPAAEMEPILVASADIHYNDLLTPESVRFEEWPKGKVPPGALTTLDELQGRRSATKLFAGEPILSGKLMGTDGGGAARKIPKGYRVVSVQVDAVSGASSLILPDDRVDVLLYMSRRPGSTIEEMSTRTILHDVRVFAVDKDFERQHGNGEAVATAKTVSLLVTPEQAEKVTLATGMGKIQLVMRSPDDSSQSDSSGANVADILGDGPNGREGDRAGGAAGLANSNTVQQPGSATGSGLNSTYAQSTYAPAPAPIAATPPPPSTWTMVLVEGSEMRDVVLTSDKFPLIKAEHVDYAPDPPTQPAAAPPVDTSDSSAGSDNDAPLRQPTAGDDGFGSVTEVPND